MEQAWHTSVRLKKLVFANEACDAEVILRRARALSLSSPRRLILKVCASATTLGLLIALGISPVLQYLSWERFATTYGEVRPITLADGSKVQLNTKSKLRVHITKGARDIALDEGEAFFTVEKDAARPFTVHVNDTFVQATGTEFAVRRAECGDVYTFVAKGNVRVPRQGTPRSADAINSVSTTVEVSAGEEATISAGSTRRRSLGIDQVNRRLAWRDGQLDFDGTIAEAVSELNRYNRRVLTIQDESISHRHIQGIFMTTDPDDFARSLKNRLGIQYWSTGSASRKDGEIFLGSTR